MKDNFEELPSELQKILLKRAVISVLCVLTFLMTVKSVIIPDGHAAAKGIRSNDLQIVGGQPVLLL